jgi:glycosyltransferase involved in cell wall biosynthesis
MNIGIDARLIHETGVGRYIRNLIKELSIIDKKNSYVVYVMNGTRIPFELPATQWKIRFVSARWHTIREQLELPFYYKQDQLDVLHVPYFTVPLLYPGTIVTTLHDLTILRVTTGKASTLPYPLYVLKKLGYRFVLEQGLRKAKHIIAVSQATKTDALQTFQLHNPISVTYEGVDDIFFQPHTHEKDPINSPYIVYVGNAYPHKNLDLLLDVAEQIKASFISLENRLKIVMIGPKDYFYEKFLQEVKRRDLDDVFYLPDSVNDIQLRNYFEHAIVTISPSKAEGFALPLLEALAANCRILVSDIAVFRELLPSTSSFLSPNDSVIWTREILKVYKEGKKSAWKNEQEKKIYFQKFSWRVMASDTLAIYEKSIH